MSQLQEFRRSMGTLLTRIDKLDGQYHMILRLVEKLDEASNPAEIAALLEQSGYKLQISTNDGSRVFDLPQLVVPGIRTSLHDLLNKTGLQIIDCWSEVHQIAVGANVHCEQAKARAVEQSEVPQPSDPPAKASPYPLEVVEENSTPLRTSPVGS